jgi:invasion protein IalB
MQHKMTIAIAALVVVIVAGALTDGARAQQLAQGQFRDWAVFTEQRGDDLVCFAATRATSSAPTTVNHGDVWYNVSSWRSGEARNQPSVKVGYSFRQASAPRLTIGRLTWNKFAAGNEAFADDADDPRIVSAIRAGTVMTLTATSARGTNVTYRFSLRGSAAAIDKAAELCR